MSISGINSGTFNTAVSIYRKGFAVSDVGDFDVSPSLFSANLPAIIQPKQSELVYELQGANHYQTHICYINSGSGVRVDDIIKDTETGIKYTVISVENFSVAKSSVSGMHHTRLSLESIGAGPAISTSTTVRAKTHVHLP